MPKAFQCKRVLDFIDNPLTFGILIQILPKVNELGLIIKAYKL